MKTTKLAVIVLLTMTILVACKKGSNTKDNNNTGTAEYYFKGTLAGKALNWPVTNGADGWVVGSDANGSSDMGELTGQYTALISASAGFQPQIGVEFRTFHVLHTEDRTAVFNAFVKTGAQSFATVDELVVGSKKIVIHYTDATGKAYFTFGAQAGSNANVIAVTPVPATVGRDESLKIKLTFNCILYPEDGTGPALTLTNAEATVLLEDSL